MAGNSGKRGWAIKLSANSTTLDQDEEQQAKFIGDTDTLSHVKTTSKSKIVELFNIGTSKEKEEKGKKKTEAFIHQVRFHRP